MGFVGIPETRVSITESDLLNDVAPIPEELMSRSSSLQVGCVSSDITLPRILLQI